MVLLPRIHCDQVATIATPVQECVTNFGHAATARFRLELARHHRHFATTPAACWTNRHPHALELL
jgi:hypothetical protein